MSAKTFDVLIGFANALKIGEDGWAMIAPYGDYPGMALVDDGKGGTRKVQAIQRLNPKTVGQMVNEFQQAGKGAKKYLAGRPIYKGHPDVPGMEYRYPDKTPKGVFSALEAREDGFYGQPVLMPEGQKLVSTREANCLSGRWTAEPTGQTDEQGREIFEPTLLISAGLTNRPNLPVEMMNEADSEFENSAQVSEARLLKSERVAAMTDAEFRDYVCKEWLTTKSLRTSTAANDSMLEEAHSSRPVTTAGKKVVCQNCKKEFDFANTPESSMGACKCPHCKQACDQDGKVVNCEASNGAPIGNKNAAGEHRQSVKLAQAASKEAAILSKMIHSDVPKDEMEARHAKAHAAHKKAESLFRAVGNNRDADFHKSKAESHEGAMAYWHQSFMNEPDEGTPLRIIAVHLRAMNFTAQNAHNLVVGDTFHEDHEHFSELSGAYGGAYDSVVERMVGNGEAVDAASLQVDAASLVPSMGGQPEPYYGVLLLTEAALQSIVNGVAGQLDEADKQLLGDIANASKDRSYKMSQRIKQPEAAAEAEVANAGTSAGVKKSWDKRRQGIANRMDAARRNYEDALHHSVQGNSKKAKSAADNASMHANTADKLARELDSGYGDAIQAHEHAGKAHRDATAGHGPHTEYHKQEAAKHKAAAEQLRQLATSKPEVANAVPPQFVKKGKAKPDDKPEAAQPAPPAPAAEEAPVAPAEVEETPAAEAPANPEATPADETPDQQGSCPACKAAGCDECELQDDGSIKCAACGQASPADQWGVSDDAEPGAQPGGADEASALAIRLASAAVAGKDVSFHREAAEANRQASEAHRSLGNDAKATWHDLQAKWHDNYADKKEAQSKSPMDDKPGSEDGNETPAEGGKPAPTEAKAGNEPGNESGGEKPNGAKNVYYSPDPKAYKEAGDEIDDSEVKKHIASTGSDQKLKSSGKRGVNVYDELKKKAEAANEGCGDCGSVKSVTINADVAVTPTSEPPRVAMSEEAKAKVPESGQVTASDDKPMGTPAGQTFTKQEAAMNAAELNSWKATAEAEAANTAEAHQKAADAHVTAAQMHEDVVQEGNPDGLGIHTMSAELHDNLAMKHLHLVAQLGGPVEMKPEVANTNTQAQTENDEDMKTRQQMIAALKACGVELANEATDEQLAAEVVKLGEAAKAKVTLANELDTTKATVTASTKAEEAAKAEFANERDARINDQLGRAMSDGRITAAERVQWLSRLKNPATFANELVNLNALQPKYKVSSLTLERGDRKVELTDPKTRADMFNELVDEVCKDKGWQRKKDYDKAVQEVYRRHPALADSQQHPSVVRPGVRRSASDPQ